jgi:hypothetical protein
MRGLALRAEDGNSGTVAVPIASGLQVPSRWPSGQLHRQPVARSIPPHKTLGYEVPEARRELPNEQRPPRSGLVASGGP